MAKINKVQGISFPDEELLVAAMRKAKILRRSLSNYICGLVEADLVAAGIQSGDEFKESSPPAGPEKVIAAGPPVSYSQMVRKKANSTASAVRDAYYSGAARKRPRAKKPAAPSHPSLTGQPKS